MNYLIEFNENVEEECNVNCICTKCEIENLNVQVLKTNDNKCFIRTNNINKFIQDWNELFVFQIKKYSKIKSEVICEQCEKYMDHNFHDEAEILGECGSCEIY